MVRGQRSEAAEVTYPSPGWCHEAESSSLLGSKPSTARVQFLLKKCSENEEKGKFEFQGSRVSDEDPVNSACANPLLVDRGGPSMLG